MKKLLNSIKKNKEILIFDAILALALLAYYIYFLVKTNTIRTWDESCYWINTIKTSSFNLIEAIKQLIRSINNDEYNLLASFILQPIFFFTTKSFNSYVLSTFFIYVLPCIIAFSFLIKKCNNLISDNKTILPITLGTLAFVLLPQIHYPVLTGYLDIAALTFVFIVYTVIATYDFKEFNLKKSIILGICIFLIALLRRYYMFWIIGFYASLFIIHFIFDLFKEKKITNNLTKTKNMILAGLMSLIPLLLCAPLMIYRVLQSNYSNSYAAYKFSGFFGEIMSNLKEIGIVLSIVCILGYVLSIINRKTRKLSLVFILNFFITIFLFNRIQTMGPHHKYLILPAIVYGIAMFIACIYNSKFLQNKKYIKYITSTLFALILITVFIFANINTDTKNIFSQALLIPIKRNDISKIESIVNYIDEITKDTDKKIYIIAGSIEYNDETFSHYNLPDLNSDEHYSEVSQVDLTHGFNKSIYEANYVMTITPIQYHLRQEDQQVITVLYKAIENDTPLSDNYNLIYEDYGDISYKMYERIKEFDEEDKQYLANEFNKYYPEQKELFEDRILD